MGKSDIIRKLQDMRSRYRETLPQRLWEIRDCWEDFAQGQEHSGVVEQLYQHLHNLAGSAETFGLPHISSCARRCLDQLRPLYSGEQTVLVSQSLRICEDSLEEIFDSLWYSGASQDGPDKLTTEPDTATWPVILYAMPGDPSLTNLAESLKQKDLPIQVHSTLPGGEVSDETDCSAFLLDLNLVSPGSEPVLANHWLGRPLAVLAGANDFKTRVRAVRAGADTLFNRPFDVAEITGWLESHTRRDDLEQGRILVLTGNNSLLPGIETHLAQRGYETEHLKDPNQLLQHLAAFRPELVIIDGASPPFSDREIAAAIRIDPKNVTLPILLVTDSAPAERLVWGTHDPEVIRVPSTSIRALIQVVREQLCRSRRLRSLMSRDSLTQLLNHGECQQQLRLALLRAQRYGQNLCVAMVDIDHFKAINDRLGHARGDHVLKSTARLMTLCLRRTDLIARYGGEEFLLVLPDTDLDNARHIADSLRQRYAAFNHGQQDQPLHASISIGLADYPAHSSPQALLRAADQALYQAKREGRNRTIAAHSQTTPNGSGDPHAR